jgi:hypothetical protein
VSFRVGDAVFEQAVARRGTVAPFRGLRVVPAFPTVADAGWLVVTAPAHSADVHPGDRIVAVGAVTLSPVDLPSAITSHDPELRLVRGDRPALVHWSPQRSGDLPK